MKLGENRLTFPWSQRWQVAKNGDLNPSLSDPKLLSFLSLSGRLHSHSSSPPVKNGKGQGQGNRLC